MAFQNNYNLENILPTSKPNTTGIFSGNQNMNINQTASRSATVALPPQATNHGCNHTYQGRLPNQGNNQATNQAQTSKTGTYRVLDEPREIVEPRINPITGRRKVAIIKSQNLCYEGNNFQEFLDRFKLSAEVYGAVGYNMQELEAIDGYEKQNWTTLRANMVGIWEDSYAQTVRSGGPKGLKEFKKFKSKDQQDVTHIFFQGFPKDMQGAIQHEMVSSNLTPYGRDGYSKTHLEDLMDITQEEESTRVETIIHLGNSMIRDLVTTVIEKAIQQEDPSSYQADNVFHGTHLDPFNHL
ncbi:hypothetical protein VP01_1846g4 [Puccinia sorghi]|uniref:Uncharacterized protein n=1 Tax=Puccinia sorghi TaxID=27349 RepID=A0A0L6VFK0_9BASI|nr:hypothetical protein VP01_1846g4 [Puccinia sorghi]